jgi:hypothetical protein
VKAAAVAVTLLPAVAGAQEGETREALYTALAMNECSVTEDQTPAVFGAQGFDLEYVRHELGRMVLDETAFLEKGYILRVKAEYCPPVDPAPTPAQAFRQTIVAGGCSIDDADARALGMDVERMRRVVLGWIDDGSAVVEGETLTLTECG